MKKKVFFGIVLFVVLSLSFSACSKSGTDTKKSDAGLYQAYMDHLNANKDAIKKYTWQKDRDGKEYSKNVALFDLNEDGSPELIYMAADDVANAHMHICTFDGWEVADQEYNTKAMWPADNGGLATENRLKDADIGGGTRFMLCDIATGKHFYIAFSQTDSFTNCTINEYEMDENGKITLVKAISNYSLHEKDKGGDLYWIDQESVAWDKGAEAFTEAGKQYKQIIMYSGNETDMSLFQKFSAGDEIAMSFDDMITHLNKLLNEK